MNELAKLLREASEGRWITTKSGNRIFIGSKAESTAKIQTKVFDEKNADASWYNNLIGTPEEIKYMKERKGVEGKIEHMSPVQYLERIGKDIHKKEVGRDSNNKRIWAPMTLQDEIADTNKELSQKYADMVKKGSPMPMPYIDYVDNTQEGRHRAYAAKLLGVEKMPVLIVRKVK